MVSMVDKDGKLIPEQGGARSTSPAPVVIRKGLDIDKIMMHLSDTFNSWDYRQVVKDITAHNTRLFYRNSFLFL